MDTIESLKARFAEEGEVTFAVRARPGASKSKIVGAMDDDSVKIDIAAAPEDGKANVELIKFLAEVFDVGRHQIAIIGGIATRRKIVRISQTP